MIKKINFPVIIILAFSLISMSAISGCSTPEGAAAETENEPQPAEAEQINLEDFSADSITINAEIKTGEYPFSYTDNSTGITMYWYNDSENLYIALESQSQGWTSIGFGPEASMKSANIIMLAVEDDAAIARDDYGTSGFSHSSDEDLGGSFNITEYAGKKNEYAAIYEFTIPLKSGDEFDSILEPGNSYSVILAVHSESNDFDRKHSRRSGTIIKLK